MADGSYWQRRPRSLLTPGFPPRACKGWQSRSKVPLRAGIRYRRIHSSIVVGGGALVEVSVGRLDVESLNHDIRLFIVADQPSTPTGRFYAPVAGVAGRRRHSVWPFRRIDSCAGPTASVV